VIPNLNREVQRLPISSVVLSSQRVDLKNALYNAQKSKDQQTEEAVNPLVNNGAKLIPSVTRVFSRDQHLYVYLQAYEQGEPQTQPLVAYVSFYRGPQKTFETRPVQITQGWDNHVKTMPLAFNIPLSALTPGAYDCQVTVLDPTGEKAAFWQAPMMLLP